MPDSEALELFRKHLDGELDLPYVRQRLHEIYQQPVPDGPIRTPDNPHGRTFLFKDHQPGTTEWARAHLVGSAAPEPFIERLGPIGAEDFGPVELLDGRTGEPLARVNRHVRRRLDAR